MVKNKQIAIQISCDDLEEIDAVASAESRSRAEVIRMAIREWLMRRREAAVDTALAEGYGVAPPGREEETWADLSLEGLEAGDLDW